MPAVPKDQALGLLTSEVREKLGVDELLEVYHEVFPDNQYTAEEAQKDARPLIERLAGHISSNLAVDEILDLWGLIIPRDRNVWYDDEAGQIHYNEELEAISAE
jgi:hypothetical protein